MISRHLLGRLTLITAFAACNNVTPLDAPLSADHVTVGGAHLVLSNADLLQMAKAVAHTVGTKLEVAIPPIGVPGLAGAELGPRANQLHVTGETVHVGANGALILQHSLKVPSLSLTVHGPKNASCSLTMQSGEMSVTVSLLLQPQADGPPKTVLGAKPLVAGTGSQLTDLNGCLAAASPGAVSFLAEHVVDAMRSSVASRFETAARDILSLVVPTELEASGSAHLALSHNQTGSLGYTSTYSAAEKQTNLLSHNGNFTSVALSFGTDAARHPCAIDAPPPQVVAQPLGLAAPPAPPGAHVLRRALAIDRAVASRLTWALQRSGALCRAARLPPTLPLSAQWAAAVLPGLQRWVKEAPTRARFWPGAAADMQWVQNHDGPGWELRLPAATLEIVAPVSGVELVVLRVEGTFVVKGTVPIGAAGVHLAVDAVEVQSASVSSTLLQGAAGSSHEQLQAVVDRVCRHMFAGPVAAWVVPGTQNASVVGAAKVGQRLWLWLEEAPPGGG